MSKPEASGQNGLNGQHSPRGQMTHLDTDVLAEFRAGLITGRRGAKIAAHLAGCDHCAALDGNLAGVSALLASVPAASMPDSVARRLDTVLAAEVASRNNPERAGVERPGQAASHDRRPARRGFRLAAWRVLAPAGAAVVVLAGGGYGLSLIVGGSGSPQMSSAAAGSVASGTPSAAAGAERAAGQANPPEAGSLTPGPSAHSQLRPQVAAVSPATLRENVKAELQRPLATRPTKASSSQVRGCVYRLTAGAAPELVENVQFNGQPATIIVARTGPGYTAWVEGAGCSASRSDLLDSITLPSGISTP
jgi:hypothetical protein